MRLGGQSTPRGGDKTNRYTSVRPRTISVRANISAGQSRNSSVMEALAREYQTEAGVGASLRKLSIGTSCSWWAIVACFSLLIPLSGGTMARCQFRLVNKLAAHPIPGTEIFSSKNDKAHRLDLRQ